VVLENRIERMIEEELALLGFELVKLEGSITGKRKVIRLYIDSPERGVSVDDCVHVSKTIGFMLDQENLFGGPYNLEVSSPGMNRPLVKPEHFRRFVGKTAKIVISVEGGGTRTRIGEIIGADDRSVTLSAGGVEENIPFDRISRANLHGEKWKVTGSRRSGE
jgi:ribosome maturation factor RimP